MYPFVGASPDGVVHHMHLLWHRSIIDKMALAYFCRNKGLKDIRRRNIALYSIHVSQKLEIWNSRTITSILSSPVKMKWCKALFCDFVESRHIWCRGYFQIQGSLTEHWNGLRTLSNVTYYH